MDSKVAQRGDDMVAGRVFVLLFQLGISLFYIRRNLELYLRQLLTISSIDILVDDLYYMENYIIIMCIVVVAVPIPVAGAVVYLDIAHPKCIIYAYFCIKEVWTGIGIVQSGVNHLYGISVSGYHVSQGK